MRELLWAPDQRPSAEVRGVVLLLHGGTVRSTRPVTRLNLTFERARRLRQALAPTLTERGISSALLKYDVRGWNAQAGEPSPLADARWALEEVRARYDVPIVVVGHSMGARAGLRVVDQPNVVGLVALAPWFPADEDVSTLDGRALRVIHGVRDRITSPRESRILVERATAVAASATYQPMPRCGHYMLTSVQEWNRQTANSVIRILEASRSHDDDRSWSSPEPHDQ